MATNGNGAKAITKAQRDQFLNHVREGLTRPQAAKAVDETLTGSRFRTLCAQDEAFNAEYEEARAIGRGNFQDQLRTDWTERAKTSDRLFTLQLITYLDELAWKRNTGRPATTEEQVKQHVDVAIEAVLDELATRREARALRASTPGAVARDS